MRWSLRYNQVTRLLVSSLNHKKNIATYSTRMLGVLARARSSMCMIRLRRSTLQQTNNISKTQSTPKYRLASHPSHMYRRGHVCIAPVYHVKASLIGIPGCVAFRGFVTSLPAGSSHRRRRANYSLRSYRYNETMNKNEACPQIAGNWNVSNKIFI